MTSAQFQVLLQADRPQAIKLLMTAKVGEWQNDGIEEMTRCLCCWAERGLDLSKDEELCDMALGCLVDDSE